MNPSQLRLKALRADDLIDRIVRVAPALWPNTQVKVDMQTNAGSVSFAAASDAVADQLATLRQFSIDHSFVECANAQVQLVGGGENINYGTPDAVLAHFDVNAQSSPRKFEIVDKLRGHFDFISSKDVVTRVNPTDHALAALKLREASVEDLRVQLDKMGTLLGTLTERDVELRRKRMAELEAEHQERLTKFEADRAQTLERDERQRQAKLDELEQAEAALKQKQAEFETREAKFVRRDLLRKLDALLDSFGTFKLSTETDAKRKPVRMAAKFMAVIFLLLAGIGGGMYFYTLDMHYLPASTAGLIGFSATMLFYLKWSDRWFREHADEEMQAKRYKADMLRASWVAELASEWAKEGKEVPAEMVGVFARNLFSVAATTDVEHPAETIVGLVKKKLDIVPVAK